MDFVGIDLHKTSGQICVLSEGCELTGRRLKIAGAGFDEVFAGKPAARQYRNGYRGGTGGPS